MGKLKQLVGVLAFSLAGPVSAGVIGLDMDYGSGSGEWEHTVAHNWTFGFAFSIDSEQEVEALGFWDENSSHGLTSVGLWNSNGALLGSVTSSSTVDSVGTANSYGYWRFMEFAYSLAAGQYVVGARGDQMEYAYYYRDENDDDDTAITTNILTYIEPREKASDQFQYPGTAGCDLCEGYFGANIRFANPVYIPAPGSLALLALGLMGIHVLRRKVA